jgi:transposase
MKFSRPIYYRLINGNMTDISCMSLCVKGLGITQVVFIADKGFYSEKNVTALEEQNRCTRSVYRASGTGVKYPKESESCSKN